MDNKDKLLISILRQNGRTSLSELGKELGMSHVAVSKRLEEDMKEYVKTSKKEGISKKEIKETLINSGIDKKTIKKLMKKI